jgi:hypothetical protein
MSWMSQMCVGVLQNTGQVSSRAIIVYGRDKKSKPSTPRWGVETLSEVLDVLHASLCGG